MRNLTRAFAMLLATTALAQAADNVVVVELYTSQGCSSCPPADKLMHDLADLDGVIPLALHVDYWDYIGWKDEFARPEHTDRQRAYARAKGDRTIYTPQMVIGGVDHVIGNRPGDVAMKLKAHAELESPIALTLTRDGNSISISAAAEAQVQGPLLVQLVRYNPGATVEIKRGENRGRTLDYVNIVEDWQVLAEWDPSQPLQLTSDVMGDEPCVVIVQTKDGHGPILAAARAF